VCSACEGEFRERIFGQRLRLGQSSVVLEALEEPHAIMANPLNAQRDSLAGLLGMKAVAAARVRAGGDVDGVLVLMNETVFENSPQGLEGALRILASVLGTQMEAARNAQQARLYRRRADDLMSLPLDSTRPLRIADFARRFAARAADMLGARNAALGLVRGAKVESLFFHGEPRVADAGTLSQLESVLAELALRPSSEILVGAASAILGSALAAALQWSDITVARLTGSDGDLLGVLCLANRERELSAEERNLLKALVSHASVTVENFRRFSQIEQSKRQWVEDIDAISDFIVVHDRAHRILRVNRSLAAYIGSRPSGGEDARSVRGSGRRRLALPLLPRHPGNRRRAHSVRERPYLFDFDVAHPRQQR